MLKITDIKLIDGKRVSMQEEIGTQVDDLRNLSEKANRYAQELESAARGIIYTSGLSLEERLKKTHSEFIAAIQFVMIYENNNGGNEE